MDLNERNSVAEEKERQNELISVIICTYNRVGLLGRSIQSVLSQTYTNLELLIIDDCSADNTGEFVKGLSDQRIRYYRNENNLGLSASKNRGASLAKGELLAFQDDDDEWKPEKLATLMEVWIKERTEETGMIYHEMQEQGASAFIPSRDIPLEWKSKDIFRHMLLYPMIGATASLIRKSCLDELGGFNEKLGSIEDYEFYLRMASKYRILFVEEPLMIIYDTPGSVNKRFKSKIDTELYILDTMYEFLCKYGILQEKIDLIRQQAENYDCDEYFYEQILQLCEQKCDAGKGAEIKKSIRKVAMTFGKSQRGDRSAYYQNAAGQIGRLTESLSKLQNNISQNPSMVCKNNAAICQALREVIGDIKEYTDLSLHPQKERARLGELEAELGKEQGSGQILCEVLNGVLEEAKELMRQIGDSQNICTVCGSKVRFLPLSPYRKVMRAHYGYQRENVEFLFEDENKDRCPVCGAAQKDRFLVGFMEDVQAEGNERLKIFCMKPKGSEKSETEEYVKGYAEKRTYLEYIDQKPEPDNGEKADVILCADILEQSANDLIVLKEMHEMLADDGVGIVVVSALSTGEAAEERPGVTGAECWENFGLEDVCRVYSKEKLVSQFTEAGFEVQTADINWFGDFYYESYGFSDVARLFILTKKSEQL